MEEKKSADSATEWTDEDELDPDKPENNPAIKKLTSNWKLIGIISAFVNRCILDKVNLNQNLIVKNKKVVTSANTGDPTILNVANVDVYSLNLFRQIHQSFDIDIKYLQSQNLTSANGSEELTEELTDDVKDMIEKILIGLTTLNEQTVNFLSDGCENLYDQKNKKIVEYFIRQRDYYFSIGRVKVKYNKEDKNQ